MMILLVHCFIFRKNRALVMPYYLTKNK